MNRRKAIMVLPFLAVLPWLSKVSEGDRKLDATDRKKRVNEALSQYAETKRAGLATKHRAVLRAHVDGVTVTIATDNEEAAEEIKTVLERSRSDAAYTDHDAARDIGMALVKNQERIRIEVA